MTGIYSLESYTVEMPLADTEYSFVIPRNTEEFEFQIRPNGGGAYEDMRYSFTQGKVAGSLEPYSTLDGGLTWFMEHLKLTVPVTIYFACSAADQVVEITLSK